MGGWGGGAISIDIHRVVPCLLSSPPATAFSFKTFADENTDKTTLLASFRVVRCTKDQCRPPMTNHTLQGARGVYGT